MIADIGRHTSGVSVGSLHVFVWAFNRLTPAFTLNAVFFSFCTGPDRGAHPPPAPLRGRRGRGTHITASTFLSVTLRTTHISKRNVRWKPSMNIQSSRIQMLVFGFQPFVSCGLGPPARPH